MNFKERIACLDDLGNFLKSANQMLISLGPGESKIDDDASLMVKHIAKNLLEAISGYEMVNGYKQDAIEQVEVVLALINECGDAPHEGQFRDIKLAHEMAAARIKEYQQMVGYAAKLQELGVVAGEEEA